MFKFLIIICSVVLYSLIRAPMVIAQEKGYLYTTIRLPLIDYITGVKDDGFGNHDGIFFNAGYAIKVVPEFFVETGIDYLIVNAFEKKFYDKKFKHTSSLEMRNTSFALQARPTYRTTIDADEQTVLSLGLGFNLQKLYINGEHLIYDDNEKFTRSETDKKRSNFFLSMQPTLSISFKAEKSMEYIFGVTYTNIRWNKAERNLSFPTFKQEIPYHRTSNVFFSAGFLF